VDCSFGNNQGKIKLLSVTVEIPGIYLETHSIEIFTKEKKVQMLMGLIC